MGCRPALLGLPRRVCVLKPVQELLRQFQRSLVLACLLHGRCPRCLRGLPLLLCSLQLLLHAHGACLRGPQLLLQQL